MFENHHLPSVCRGKPHIQKVGGYWQISTMKRPKYDQLERWRLAYNFVFRLNGVPRHDVPV